MKIKLNETLLRKEKTKYWLSKETGIAASTISNLCNNKTDGIQFSVLEKICQALDCSPNEIFEIENRNDDET